ncbi:REF/SRPP-like protein At1g67360 [Papaver somniferum]|uniref:REF/SRPP-like protein At1g67360 n=1 Tax=Papaver somniferum TaxID=3469 RepID=UPI000E6FE19E|nr:REF/SRPP-like protein At1g67360 [Papaver somniferum]
MATNKVASEVQNKNTLKYLWFVKIAAIHGLICLWNLYEYGKQNTSGSLRSAIGKAEGTVTSIFSPVCDKFKNVPYDLLLFFDNKLDEAVHKFVKQAPALANQVTSQSCVVVQKVSQMTKAIVSETQTRGLSTAAIYVVNTSEIYLMEQAAKTWHTLVQVSPLNIVTEVVVPIAAHWSDKYNQLVISMTRKGFFGLSYLPLVPVDIIPNNAKASKMEEEVKKQDGVKSSSEI